MSIKNYSGFTLIELLIVLTLMMVLIGIAIPSYNIFNTKGRDSKRQSDLKTIQSALSQYRADQGFYPLTLTFGQPLTGANGRMYHAKIPSEPVASRPSYLYHPKPTGCNNTTVLCANFCLYAQMENSSLEDRSSACPDIQQLNYEVSGI